MAKITLNLISGRTIQQGVALKAERRNPPIARLPAIIELDPSDLKKLGAWKKHQCQGNERSRQRCCEINRDYAGSAPGGSGSFQWDPGRILLSTRIRTQRVCRRSKAYR